MLQVTTHFSVVLPATATFDYPTVAALAAYIASKSVAAVVTTPTPAVVSQHTGPVPGFSTAMGTSDLIGMSSMLATSPVPGQGESLAISSHLACCSVIPQSIQAALVLVVGPAVDAGSVALEVQLPV